MSTASDDRRLLEILAGSQVVEGDPDTDLARSLIDARSAERDEAVRILSKLVDDARQR